MTSLAGSEPLNITIQVHLTPVQQQRLQSLARQIPESATAEPRVTTLISGLASAALAEYLAHTTLQPPITTVAALRELRLAVLSEHLLGGHLPSEGFVAELFALTASEARTLLRRSVARQPERLHAAILQAAQRSVVNALG